MDPIIELEPAQVPARVLALRAAFHEVEVALEHAGRKTVLLGLELIEQKRRVEHREFGPWLRANVFPEASEQEFAARWAYANRAMTIAATKCSELGLLSSERFALPEHTGGGPPQIHTVCEFDSGAGKNSKPEVSLSILLQTPSEELPEHLRAVQLEFWSRVDGRSLRELMGMKSAKRPGGFLPTSPAAKISPERSLELHRQWAAENWLAIEISLKGHGASFMLLDDLEVETQIAFLETQLSARKRWVNTPPKKRNPREIEDFLKSAN